MSIQVLSPDLKNNELHDTPTIDIIAIHGLHEGPLNTWTEPKHNILWLRDLLSHDDLGVRVLAYGYDAETLLSPGGRAQGILPVAITMIAQLDAYRKNSNTSERPIIFICHGFGGILLKRALVFSSSSRGEQVRHRRSIYISTYAILFMGTPHRGLSKEAVIALSKHRFRGPNQFLLSLLQDSEILEDITSLFSPLANKFKINFFWELLDSKTRSFRGRIVVQESAAPAWQDAERCGIMANHSDMVKFSDSYSRGFLDVMTALRRYSEDAREIVQGRWEHEHRKLSRVGYVSLETFPAYTPSPDLTDEHKRIHGINEIYAVNRCSTNYFTGRKLHARDMKEAFDAAQAETHLFCSRIFVIYGLGGSGKTQFSLKYIEENRSRYWGIFWVDASSEENIESSFALIALQAGKGTRGVAGIHWLSSQRKPWMLVIDNAGDPDTDISKYFPQNMYGHILITTRNPGFTSLSTVGNFRFKGMEPEEAIALLLRSAHLHSSSPSKKQTRIMAQKIASELGYLASALNHAGVAIRRNIYTIDKYLHYYLGYRRERITYPSINNVDDANFFATWEIPYRKIETRASLEYQDAVEILRLVAFLHFESISEDVFIVFWSASNGNHGQFANFPHVLQNEAMLTEESIARLRRAFRVLYDHSIIDYDPIKRVCSLHPVIHTWARNRLTEDEHTKYLHFASAMVAECISANIEISGHSFRRKLLPHIDSLLRTLRKLPGTYPNNVQDAAILERFAVVYSENGLWQVARELQRKVVRIRLSKQWRFQKEPLSSQKALADIFCNLFDIKACIDIHLEIVKIRFFFRSSPKAWFVWPPWQPVHTGYCDALSDLTQSLWLAGESAWSKHTGEQALSGLIRNLGVDDPLTLNAMFNLARVYHHLWEYRKSHPLLVYVVRRRKHFFGADHPDTLMARNELGLNQCALGHLKIAERMILNVLAARRRILGDEHAYTLCSVNEYSKVLCERGKSHLAVEVLEEIIPIVLRTLGDDHVVMQMTKSNLARAFAINKQWDQASAILQHLSKNTAANPDWMNVMCAYIHVRVKMGHLLETQDDCEKALLAIVNQKFIASNSLHTLGLAETLVEIYKHKVYPEKIITLYNQIPGLKEALRRQGERGVSIFSELYSSQSELKRTRLVPATT